MKKLMMAMAGVLMAFGASAATATIDGVTWTYTVSNGKASVGDGLYGGKTAVSTSTVGELVIPEKLGSYPVTSIGNYAFYGCDRLTSVTIPTCVKSIGRYAFEYCDGLTSVTIPNSITSIDEGAFARCTGIVEFSVSSDNPNYCSKNGLLLSKSGDVLIQGVNGVVTIPSGVRSIGQYSFCGCGGLMSVTIPDSVSSIADRAFDDCNALCNVVVDPRNEFFRIRRGKLETRSGGVIVDFTSLQVRVLSSQIRENDPMVMDVTYRIRSSHPTVKVRVLAFEDGQRSFAKVVRPETFVDGTEVNVGDAITPNVEHKISWRVSGDWATKLAKLKFEVLASEGELLPLETMTIPASDQYGKMQITHNAISESQVFDALLWLYADKDPGLTLSNGVLKNGSVQLASGTSLYRTSTYVSGSGYVYAYYAPEYVLQKMGYSLLTGAPLTYANQETRIGLSPSGARQYGYKIVE